MSTHLRELDPDHLISSAELSSIIGIKQSTLAQWRWAGVSPIPYTKIGSRRVLYRVGDVIDYIDRHRKEGAA